MTERLEEKTPLRSVEKKRTAMRRGREAAKRYFLLREERELKRRRIWEWNWRVL